MCAEGVESKTGGESLNNTGQEETSDRKREDGEKEWKEFEKKIRTLRDRVYNKAKEKLGNRRMFWFEETIDPFLEELERKFPNCEKYVAYQVLKESSPRFEETPYFDFSDSDYSVGLFLLKCERELDEMDVKEKGK